jgi:hypothetical protein
MKPWNMAGKSASSSGQDYTVSGTAMGVLQAGMWYQFVVYVNNYSGNVTCPGIAAGANLIALCCGFFGRSLGGHTIGCTWNHEDFPHNLTRSSPYQLAFELGENHAPINS